VARAAGLKLKAEVEPLMFHNSAITVSGRAIPFSFDQQKQNLVESLRYTDGSTLKELPYGKGRIFWAACPLELAETTDAAAALYSYVAARVGITPMFDLQSQPSPGVLVFPIVLEDSVLYIMASESADDTKIDLRDNFTGVRFSLQLPSQHAAIALISKKNKSVIAKYGF
jgi:hypothetical protein